MTNQGSASFNEPAFQELLTLESRLSRHVYTHCTAMIAVANQNIVIRNSYFQVDTLNSTLFTL